MLSCYRTKLVERRSGGIEGVGLFAVKDIKKGQLLALKGGRLINEEVLLKHLSIINGSHHQVGPNLFLAGLTPEEVNNTLIGYNHSCEPNAYVDGQIALRALRSISKGEEITVDYCTIFSSDTQSFGCKCGSKQCRHFIKPSRDSKNPTLRSKYRGYFADFLAHPKSYETQLAPIDPDCPITSYLTPKVRRISAKIHGLGLSVVQPIKEGELLAIRGGKLVSKRDVIAHQAELQGGEVQISDDIFMAGFSEQERLATMMGFNHSCEPNAYIRGQISIFALSDISVGSELTVDYATAYISPSQRFQCNCQTSSCRKFVDTTVDWQNPEIQNRYQRHFADFIQRKIRQNNS